MPEELRLIPRSSRLPSPTLRDLVAVVFRQRRLAVICFAGVSLAVLLYRVVTPNYQAEMKVLVRHGRVDPAVTATPTEPQFEREAVSEEELNSEVELLRDQEILRTVAKASGLAADEESWFWKLAGETEDERLTRTVQRLGRRLQVEPVHKTTLITITYDSGNPAQAANVLRCLAGAYLERHARLHRPAEESDFFEQQIAESRRGLERAELQLMEFTRDQGVVSAAQQRDLALQRLGEAEANDQANRVAIAETGDRVRMLQAKVQSLPERTTTVIRNSDNPQLLGNVKARLLELQLKRTELLTKFAPTYRLVQEVDQQIADTRNSIAGEELAPIREQTSDLDSNHAWAKGELVKAEVELSALKTRAHVNKREEARIGDALDRQHILNAIIAEQPVAPALPSRSGLSVGLIGLIFAGGLSTSLAFAADRLNPAFRTPDEVVAYLGTPVLASLPRRDG